MSYMKHRDPSCPGPLVLVLGGLWLWGFGPGRALPPRAGSRLQLPAVARALLFCLLRLLALPILPSCTRSRTSTTRSLQHHHPLSTCHHHDAHYRTAPHCINPSHSINRPSRLATTHVDALHASAILSIRVAQHHEHYWLARHDLMLMRCPAQTINSTRTPEVSRGSGRQIPIKRRRLDRLGMTVCYGSILCSCVSVTCSGQYHQAKNPG